MAKQKGKTPNKKWTVKEIKGWIRERTKEVRKQIEEFQSLDKKGREGLFFRKSVKELQKAATGKTRKDMNVPVGNMTKKSDLLEQAKKLTAFGKRKSTKQIKQKVEIEAKEKARERLDKQIADTAKKMRGDDYDYTKYQLGDDGLTDSERDYLMDIGEYEKYLDEQKVKQPYEYPFENEKTERAYQRFKEHYDQSLTRDEYQQLLDIFGAIGSYMGSFGYERDLGDSKTVENITMTGNLVDYVKDKEKEGNNVISVYWAAKQAIANSEGQQWTSMQILQELDRILNPDD